MNKAPKRIYYCIGCGIKSRKPIVHPKVSQCRYKQTTSHITIKKVC